VLLVTVVLGLGLSGPARALGASPIKGDEDVVFFPGFATDAAAPSWTGFVHGWIFEPVRDPAQRATLDRVLREKLHLSGEETRSAFFRERARMFLVDNERSKSVSVTLSGRTVVLAPSKSNGHFDDQVTLRESAGKSGDWIEIRALTRPGDGRVFTGGIQLIGRRGISVVSDIDDTIKISDVLDQRELIANTFARAFRAAPGMADLYRRWAAGGNVVFHYVSGSPWPLYPALADFTQREGFPRGSFNLRQFRLKDRSAVEFLENRTLEYKLGIIEALMRRFPDRQFVLVGDSGELDPEVYAALASRFPNQVRAILIRDVRGEDLNSRRFVELYKKLPDHITRRVFRDTRELADFDPQQLLPR
jgi:phosphatidate phosphatase APP1